MVNVLNAVRTCSLVTLLLVFCACPLLALTLDLVFIAGTVEDTGAVVYIIGAVVLTGGAGVCVTLGSGALSVAGRVVGYVSACVCLLLYVGVRCMGTLGSG